MFRFDSASDVNSRIRSKFYSLLRVSTSNTVEIFTSNSVENDNFANYLAYEHTEGSKQQSLRPLRFKHILWLNGVNVARCCRLRERIPVNLLSIAKAIPLTTGTFPSSEGLSWLSSIK